MSGKLLQLALDIDDTAVALKAALAAADAVDIIEDGTVLCLAQGLGSARELRAVFPDKDLLTDIRIARAGGKFARMCFKAGADRVSVVGESGLDVVTSACEVAEEFGGGVEVELYDGWSDEEIHSFIEAGAQVFIVHRNRCDEAENEDVRTQLNRLHALVSDSGVKVTLAGGLNRETLRLFDGCPFDIAVVGSAITKADDPLAAAREIRDVLNSMK
ncbi:orotidine 5'-phosphate decarboxylase / HUMPS family protein [Bifidobacterium simiarum]|uniref:orotidine 5'-phosphate decarboxylase / HUMPS family protein n=1 Tax=Bifidobacterium simiarum TaxID=2045441 RepID=UPI001BDD9E6F|nr:orotidine 5'-phosphate decarboxylase / HUMPS family protein [Bifidobacterium simiarum]MBT1165634.1 orotidine 5'-phosphate decarboxylase [Bifidobacterium simiarum]